MVSENEIDFHPEIRVDILSSIPLIDEIKSGFKHIDE